MARIHNIGRLMAFFTILVFIVTATASYAAGFGDLKAKIGEARDTIVVMVKNKDKRGADQQKAGQGLGQRGQRDARQDEGPGRQGGPIQGA